MSPEHKEKTKRNVKNIVKGTAYALSCIIRPDEAAKRGISEMMNDLKKRGDRNYLEHEYLGKFAFFNPISNPASVVWGEIIDIRVREAGEFTLVVKHLKHNFHQYVGSDNLSLIQIFDNESDLLDFVKSEIKNGNLREGSLRVTRKGAEEYGIIFLTELKELISYDNEIQSIFPYEFQRLAIDAYEKFVNSNRNKFVFFYSEKFFEFSERYPFQFYIFYKAINNFFMMKNSTIATE